MNVRSVGPDDLSEYDMEDLQKHEFSECVYHYTIGAWEGHGVALLKEQDGSFLVVDLGHCSCHGPISHWNVEARFPDLDAVKKHAGDLEDIFSSSPLLACIRAYEGD